MRPQSRCQHDASSNVPSLKSNVSLKEQTTLRIILYEGSGSAPLAGCDRIAALAALLDKGFAVTCTGGNGRIAPAEHNALLVLGNFAETKPPAVAEANGTVPVRFHDLSQSDPARLLEAV